MASIEKTTHGSHRVRWRDADGRQRSRSFKTRKQALTFIGKTNANARAVEDDGSIGVAAHEAARAFAGLHATAAREDAIGAIDPNGLYVYCLWGVSTHRPLYVGQSRNLFGRLGQHFGDPTRKDLIRRVTLTRCETTEQMMELERRLIVHFRPRLNIIWKPAPLLATTA